MSNIDKINVNGTSYDIKDSISGYTTNTGTVTDITAGTGLTGGTISTSGTIALDTTRAITASDITTGTDTTNKLISAKVLSDALAGASGGSYTATSPVNITNNVISLEDGYGDIQNPYGAKNEHYVLAGVSSVITYSDYTTPTTATTPDNYEIDDINLPAGTYTFSGHIQVPGTGGWSGGSVGVEVDGGSTQWGNFPNYETDDSVTFTLEAPADVVLLVQSVNTDGFSSGTVSWTNLKLTSSNPLRPEFRALTKEDLPSGLITATSPINIINDVISHEASGVTAGTYNSVTVDAKGHVTAGSNISDIFKITFTYITSNG